MYKVIIVEDEDLIRKGLAYTFNWLDYDCIIAGEAANGKEALEKIEEVKPDIVITDIKMPLLDGLDMLASFQERSFETIIITGYAEFDYAKQAIKLGVSEFLLKPINHDEMGEVLRKLIKKLKNKHMVQTIREKVHDFSEINLLDTKFYFHDTNYESKYIPIVLEYIEKNYNKKISIDQIAHNIGISSTYLSKKFKKETNHTFNDFLNKYRIQKSLHLMHDSDYRIYEIAEIVGYSEYKYFSQVFKSYMGHSPSEFMQTDIYIVKD